MRQLTALDAQFLHAESATTTTHVAGVAILDPACAPTGAVTRAALIGLLRERLHLAPALSLRLVDVPFGLDRPYWEEVADLDVADHVHETTLPLPGDDAQLAERVARLHERHLDRSRPLWEMHLIQGLTGGRVALYAKVHHCVVDGVTGAETLAALLDLTPEPRAVEPPSTPPPASETPEAGEMLAVAAARLVAHPARALRALGRMAADLDAIPVASALPGARLVAEAARAISGGPSELPELPPLTAPRTPFNGPISAERRFSYGSIPLADVRHVARAFEISLNDVVMTVCASALRAWLLEHDALPDQPLIAAVPVAVRTASRANTADTAGADDGADTVGNRLSVMITPMPTDVVSPVERLRVMGRTMRAAKRRFAGSPATWLGELSSVLPPALSALATPAVFRLASIVLPPINLIVSNVPGPQLPLYLCGARLLAYYPMSVLSDMSGGLNITCFSYDGSLDFGVVACPDRVEDVWRLMGHLQEAMDELVGLAGPRPATRMAHA
ncbi:WS/DGAT/MGAT family O-acyltransferase [Streptosporangium carneum]|uniref:Diacylglycerol O-acyltransferase n=1 Tax=Streptosporangium carneum TaxID=47481 RepID=A0A9W6I849_9ACTN|nr:wax ester/triacylglycerol synthase family O-acyltransferase [Streptosporangium carneum]GLK13368.1 diacylglycerol O-acyltransferase [Streptosporangium carneum]